MAPDRLSQQRTAAVRRTVRWLVVLAGLVYAAFFVAMSLR
jgi:hypothetical protein